MGSFKGIVAIPSSHIYRGPREHLDLASILIDIGVRSREEAFERGIEILNPVTAVKDIAELAGGRIAGPMISRKFPAFALMQVLHSLQKPPERGILFAWTTQGLRRNSGIARLMREHKADKILLIQAFQRRVDRASGAAEDPVDTLGSGVLYQASGGGDHQRSILTEAEKANIPTTPSSSGLIFPRSSGLHAGKVVPLAIPVKYQGSLVEVIDRGDLKQLISLITLSIEM